MAIDIGAEEHPLEDPVAQEARKFIKETEIPGVLLIKMPVTEDERGFFQMSFRGRAFEQVYGGQFIAAQENHSRSKKGVFRGIHVAPWGKLADVVRGTIQQIVVDLRPDSKTFLKHVSFIIGEENRTRVFIPPGCGNGFLALSDLADYTYFVDQEWEPPSKEFGVCWDDQDIGLKLMMEGAPILSPKDQHNPTVRDLFPQKFGH